MKEMKEAHIDIKTLDDQIYTIPLKEIRLNREKPIPHELPYTEAEMADGRYLSNNTFMAPNVTFKEKRTGENEDKYFFADGGITDNARQWHPISKAEYIRLRTNLEYIGLIEDQTVPKLS